MITREEIETQPWLGEQRAQVRELHEAFVKLHNALVGIVEAERRASEGSAQGARDLRHALTRARYVLEEA